MLYFNFLGFYLISYSFPEFYLGYYLEILSRRVITLLKLF